jgi:hypothetical protein
MAGLLVGVPGALVDMVVVVTVVVVMVAPLVVMVVTLVRVMFVWACAEPTLASRSAASAAGILFNIFVIVFLFFLSIAASSRRIAALGFFPSGAFKKPQARARTLQQEKTGASTIHEK